MTRQPATTYVVVIANYTKQTHTHIHIHTQQFVNNNWAACATPVSYYWSTLDNTPPFTVARHEKCMNGNSKLKHPHTHIHTCAWTHRLPCDWQLDRVRVRFRLLLRIQVRVAVPRHRAKAPAWRLNDVCNRQQQQWWQQQWQRQQQQQQRTRYSITTGSRHTRSPSLTPALPLFLYLSLSLSLSLCLLYLLTSNSYCAVP